MIVRLIGVVFLPVCAFAVHWLYQLVHVVPPHPSSLGELAIAFVVVITGLGGALMAIVGDELVRNPDEHRRRY